MRTWDGTNPTKCDLCRCAIKSTFVDGRTTLGPWGILCVQCHNTYGVGLGTGKGQKYILTAGKWVNAEDIDKKPAGVTDKELQRLLDLKSGSKYDHFPREPQGVEGEDDVEYIPGL